MCTNSLTAIPRPCGTKSIKFNPAGTSPAPTVISKIKFDPSGTNGCKAIPWDGSKAVPCGGNNLFPCGCNKLVPRDACKTVPCPADGISSHLMEHELEALLSLSLLSDERPLAETHFPADNDRVPHRTIHATSGIISNAPSGVIPHRARSPVVLGKRSSKHSWHIDPMSDRG